MRGHVDVLAGDDEAVESLRQSCLEEGYVMHDKRTPWRRFRYGMRPFLWGAFACYLVIANYCRFKMALGLATVACTCGG
jgi:hypothetical protein